MYEYTLDILFLITGKLINTKSADLFTLYKITAFVHVKVQNFSCQKRRTPASNETPSDSMANISWMGKVRGRGDEIHSMAAILCSI